MARRPLHGSIKGGQLLSRPNLGGRMALWLSRVLCARRGPKSRAPSMVSMGSPQGSSEIGGRGRISAPRGGGRRRHFWRW